MRGTGRKRKNITEKKMSPAGYELATFRYAQKVDTYDHPAKLAL